MPDNRGKSLVKRLLDNPRLPAYIAHLDTPTLGRLIRLVGIEDAQELMILATPEQMQDLVEIEAWTQERPGTEERFDPERLLDWIEIWDEIGPAFMTSRLAELGEEIAALMLARYVMVVDMEETGIIDVDGDGITGTADNFGRYAVLQKDESSWPEIIHLITQVWSEDADFLLGVLSRCCSSRDVGIDGFGFTDPGETLDTDVAWDREVSRTRKGYVTPLNATLFLSETKNASMESLLVKVKWDTTTRAQLSRMTSRRSGAGARESTDSATPAGTTASPAPDDDLWRELDDMMEAAQIIERSPARSLLLGPVATQRLYLKRALQELQQRNPAALEQRLDEIVYLANVLVSGSSIQGGAFTEAEAANAVYGTCNLGMEFCVTEEPFDTEAAMIDSFLLDEPGLIKAFEIGYHLICQLPTKVIVAVARNLTSTAAQRRLHQQTWIAEQISRLVGKANLQAGVSEEALGNVRDLFETMSTLFDSEACQQMRILCDSFPCFPRSLEPGFSPGIRVETGRRYIESPSDIKTILAFLDRVDLL